MRQCGWAARDGRRELPSYETEDKMRRAGKDFLVKISNCSVMVNQGFRRALVVWADEHLAKRMTARIWMGCSHTRSGILVSDHGKYLSKKKETWYFTAYCFSIPGGT